MWSISATKTPGSKQVHATITSRKMNEGTEFAVVHSIVDFSEKIVTFRADSDKAPATAPNPDLEKRTIEWAGLRRETFTCNTAEKELHGYGNEAKRDVFWGLVRRKIFVELGTRGSGTAYRLASTSPGDSGGYFEISACRRKSPGDVNTKEAANPCSGTQFPKR